MKFPRPVGETELEFRKAELEDCEYTLQDTEIPSERTFLRLEIAHLKEMIEFLELTEEK